jgi:sugar phosphate isomerase/epimerase
MRLGGPLAGVDASVSADPALWASGLAARGFTACYFPPLVKPPRDLVNAYADAASRHGLIIAEVGAWSNPIDPDPAKAAIALEKCKTNLQIAQDIGARCCVNIAGSRNPGKWDGPHPENLTDETFDRIVQTTREIIDAVKPTHTFYTLETMPWIFPDSPDSYLRLIRAIDRPGFGVHMDPVNLVNCPVRYFNTTALINEFFQKLGPHIKGAHGKDILIENKLTLHLNECRPGTGVLDYRAFLTGLDRLGPDFALMLEHLPTAEEYALAAQHVRQVASQIGVVIK